jgi:hypothetical protein
MSSLRCSYQDTRAWLGKFSKRNAVLEIRVKVRIWKKKNKQSKVFGILSQLKKWSKSNDVRAEKTFLAARNELLLQLKIRVSEGGDIAFIH